MRLIDADKLEVSAVLGLKLQHADGQYYYFIEDEAIEKAPTVNAIPVDWLKDQIEKETYKKYLVDSVEWSSCLRWLLEEWSHGKD